MNIRVNIDDQWMEVEISDLHSRPVLAVVEGETYQVWPETERVLKLMPPGDSLNKTCQSDSKQSDRSMGGIPSGLTSNLSQVVVNRKNGGSEHKVENKTTKHPQDILRTIRAPIPGVILSVAVQIHQIVSIGQELCVLEAMKMKNSIRANRTGEIAEIHIKPGQHVKAHEILMEFVS